MLDGKNVNLKIMDRDDLPLVVEWINDPKVLGEYNLIRQISKTESDRKSEDGHHSEQKSFIIEKKDGLKIGLINHFNVIWDGVGELSTIAFFLLPAERGKDYCTEAVRLMVDYLFLSNAIPCIQATTHVQNVASQRVLQKAGFKKEGVMRRCFYIRGNCEDQILFSIPREERKEPKVLMKNI